MKLLKTFIVCFVILAITFGHPNSIKPGRLCGSMIPDALSMVCQGIYNKNTFKRSSLGLKDIEFPWLANEEDVVFIPDPFISHREALRPHLSNRIRRGIVEECCYRSHGCSLDELKTYCYYDDSD